MLFKLCLLLLIIFLIYRFIYRKTDSGSKSTVTGSEGSSRFDISRVEEAQYRDIKSSQKESDSRE